MTMWNIAATYDGNLAPDQAEKINERLSLHDGTAANLPPDRFIVSIFTEIPLYKAANDSIESINRAVASSGAPADGLCSVEIISIAELERLADQPNYPDLVSAGEVAEMLNVRRQRVHQLAQHDQGFPEPVYNLAVGKLWEASAIEAYAGQRRTSSGRPKADPDPAPTSIKLGAAASKMTQKAAKMAARKAGAKRKSSAN